MQAYYVLTCILSHYKNLHTNNGYAIKVPKLRKPFTGEVTYIPKNVSMPVTLKPRECEVFTIVPVKKLSNGASIAPIGLVKMFNSGGAIKELRYESGNISMVEMKVRGSGMVGVYSSATPKRIWVDSKEVMFGYEERTGLVTFDLEIAIKELYLWDVLMEF